jgi:hypothetical protein
VTDPIRIFVGCAPNHEDAESQSVLEWSIRKHTRLPVEITWMRLSRDLASPCYSSDGDGWDTSQWATPFSALRWSIPEQCGFQGKAIYTDSDVIFMADLAGLWNQQHAPGKFLLAKGGGQWRICVSMFDCAEAKRHVPPIEQMMRDPRAHQKLCGLIRQKRDLVQAFSGEWNCLDREIGQRPVDHPSIKAIHYTDMKSQPQLRHALPRLKAQGQKHWFDGKTTPQRFPRINALFDDLLAEATANGYGPDGYMQDPLFGDYRKKVFAA